MKKKYPKILGSLKAILPAVDHRRFELHALSRLCRDAIPLYTRLSLQASPKLRSDDFLAEAMIELRIK